MYIQVVKTKTLHIALNLRALSTSARKYHFYFAFIVVIREEHIGFNIEDKFRTDIVIPYNKVGEIGVERLCADNSLNLKSASWALLLLHYSPESEVANTTHAFVSTVTECWKSLYKVNRKCAYQARGKRETAAGVMIMIQA